MTSPEQFDQLMTVTSPMGWLSLLASAAIVVTAVVWGFFGNIPLTATGPGILLRIGGLKSVAAMVAGRITDIIVREGDVIEEGQVLAHLQPLNQYPTTASLDITSPYSGRLTRINARAGVVVQTGDMIASLASVNEEMEAVLFMPADQGKKVQLNQPAEVTLSTVDRQEYGFIYGKVSHIGRYSATQEQMKEVLGSDDMVKLFMTSSSADANPYQAAPVEVRVHLYPSTATPTGFQWSSKLGPPYPVSTGTILTAEIVTGSEHPIDLVVPYLLKKFGAGSTQ